MDKYLDAGLPDIIGRVSKAPVKIVDGYVVQGYPMADCLDAEYQETCAEGWLLGQQTVGEKIKRCSPWACICLGVCLICVIYARIGWVELEQVVPWMLSAMAFGGWKVGRMV